MLNVVSSLAFYRSLQVGMVTGVGLAVIAALGYGVAFWLLDARVSPQIGPLLPIWLIRFITPCLLATGAGAFRQSLRLPQGRARWFIGGVGLFDTVCYVASAAGLSTGPIAIVGVLISLFRPISAKRTKKYDVS